MDHLIVELEYLLDEIKSHYENCKDFSRKADDISDRWFYSGASISYGLIADRLEKIVDKAQKLDRVPQ